MIPSFMYSHMKAQQHQVENHLLSNGCQAFAYYTPKTIGKSHNRFLPQQQVPPVYRTTPAYGIEHRQIYQPQFYRRPLQSHQPQLPSSMISPPMEGNMFLHPVEQCYGLPAIGNPPACFPMSSYLTDERALETPAPFPVTCELGAETPSPSPPFDKIKSKPDLDTKDFLRLTFGEELQTPTVVRKRKSSDYEDMPKSKRHRRTRIELDAERQKMMLKSMRDFYFNIPNLQMKMEDMPVRIFKGSKMFDIRCRMPRIPRMKLSPRKFERVFNIGFLRTQHGVAFSCMGVCRFKTYDPKKFHMHLKSHDKPPMVIANPACYICNEKINTDSLLYELCHMLKEHVAPMQVLPIVEILYSQIIPNSTVKEDLSDDEAANESEAESDTTVCIDEIKMRCASPLAGPSGINCKTTTKCSSVSSNSSDDSQGTEIYNYERINSEAKDDPPLTKLQKSNKRLSISSNSSKDSQRTQTYEHEQKNSQEKDKQSESRRGGDIQVNISQLIDDYDYMIDGNLDFEIVPSTEEFTDSTKTDPDFDPSIEAESEDDPISDNEVTSDESDSSEKSEKSKTDDHTTTNSTSSSKSSLQDSPKVKTNVKKPRRGTNKFVEERSRNKSDKKSMRKLHKLEKQDKKNRNRIFSTDSESSSDEEPLGKKRKRIKKFSDSSDSLKSLKVTEAESFVQTADAATSEIHPETTSHAIEASQTLKETTVLSDNKNVVQLRMNQTPGTKDAVTDFLSRIPIVIIERITKNKQVEDCEEERPVMIENQALNSDSDKTLEATTSKNISYVSSYVEKTEQLNQIKKAKKAPKKLQTARKSSSKPNCSIVKECSINLFNKGIKITIRSANAASEKLISENREIDSTEISADYDFDSCEDAKPMTISDKNETDSDEYFDSNEIVDLPPTPLVTDKENLLKLYPWIADDVVEKWFKTKTCAKSLLDKSSLFSTYKCMSIACSYYTTDFESFQAHVNKHKGIDRYFLCCYCLADEKEPEDLFDHLEKFHTNDQYQCDKCMYRACEKVYCDIHRNNFHNNEQVSILMCRAKKPLENARKNAEQGLKSKLIKHVKLIKCKFCSESFDLIEDFVKHLRSKLKLTEDTDKITLICNEIKEISEMHEDYEFGLYQCAYCSDGFNTLDSIKDHLSVIHPHNFAFTRERKKHNLSMDIENLFDCSSERITLRDLFDNEEAKKIKVTFWNGTINDLTSVDTFDKPIEPKKTELKISNCYSIADKLK